MLSKLRYLAKHLTIWRYIAVNALQEAFVNRATNALFLFGKVIRLVMMLLFLFILKDNLTTFAGYTADQMIVFFLTYQIVDTLGQVVYRGVYLFGEQVKTGEFDFTLLKPVNPLFRALTGKPDINDAIFFIPNVVIMIWLMAQLQVTVTLDSLIWYLILMLNGFLIVTGCHIVVLVIGILTTEVDGVIWMYRDIFRLGQFPITMYSEPLRSLLFFLVPIGMMVTIPAEVLMNVTPLHSVLVAIGVGVGFFVASIRFWQWGLKQYSSASS